MSIEQQGAMERVKLVLVPPEPLIPGSMLLAMKLAAQWNHPTIIGLLAHPHRTLDINGIRITNMRGLRLYRVSGQHARQGAYPC